VYTKVCKKKKEVYNIRPYSAVVSFFSSFSLAVITGSRLIREREKSRKKIENMQTEYDLCTSQLDFVSC